MSVPGAELDAERSAIEREIEGRTLCDLLSRNASEHADRPALHWRDEEDRWQQLTWSGYRDAVVEVAMGLADLGLEHGEVVAIMATNRPEHFLADLGAVHAGATPVSMYQTLAPEQIAYVADNCDARVAVLEGADELRRWDGVRDDLPGLRTVVLLDPVEGAEGREDVVTLDEVRRRGRERLDADPGELDRRVARIAPDQAATIIYTSGTTGPPKGVVVTHRNVLWELTSVDLVDHGLPDVGLSGLCYLPLAHLAERLFSHYLGLAKAAQAYFVPDRSQALEVVQQARPDAFLGVPRVWEKIHSGLTTRLDEQGGLKRRLAHAGIAAGKEVLRREQAGEQVPAGLRARHRLLDRVVLSKIRRMMGMDEVRMALAGAAPISEEVLSFFGGLGILIHEAYGLTETTAVSHVNRPGKVRFGTVGQPLPGVECRLDDDGEVLVRGGNITAGYHRRPEATAEAFQPDGWFRTGDLGRIDDDGYLTIVGRKKEIIITAGGKNISPAAIEERLKRHPLIGQACAIGDERPYVAALIVLDGEAAPAWAERHGVEHHDLASLAEHEVVREEVDRAVQQVNAELAHVEQVKRYALLAEEWTDESDELTPTLKLRRAVIHDKHAEVIDSLYR